MESIFIYRRKDEYWHQVGLFYDQMVGLYEGYKESVSNKETDGAAVTLWDIVTMNIFGDLEDLEQAFDKNINCWYKYQNC